MQNLRDLFYKKGWFTNAERRVALDLISSYTSSLQSASEKLRGEIVKQLGPRKIYYSADVLKQVPGIKRHNLYALERKGLIHPQRSDSGLKMYSEQDLQLIQTLWRQISRAKTTDDNSTEVIEESGDTNKLPEEGRSIYIDSHGVIHITPQNIDEIERGYK